MSAFWIEDISQLFKIGGGLFPVSSNSLESNMNAISRIALLACIVIAAFKPVLGVSTFVISIVVIMAIYYSIKKSEGFRPEAAAGAAAGAVAGESPGSYSGGYSKDFCSPAPNFRPLTASEFCTNRKPFSDNPDEYVSENQMLVGGPNPKTLIPLMNATKIRSHDIEAWKPNDFTVHSAINDSNPAFDTYTSGMASGLASATPPMICKKCSSSPCTCMHLNAARKMLNRRRTALVLDTANDDLPEITIDDGDMYDPRFTGYGPTDRCYIDPDSGQRKYFYADIDSKIMHPYISRNNIDVYPWAPKIGAGYDGRTDLGIAQSVQSASHNKGLNSVKQEALDAYRCSTNRAREELQNSLMLKRNGEMWQLRQAPIY